MRTHEQGDQETTAAHTHGHHGMRDGNARPRPTRVRRQLLVSGGLTVAAGLCLMAAPFVFGYRVVGQAVANDLLAGAALVAVGVAGLRRDRRLPAAAIQAAVGAWLLMAPAVLRYDGGAFVRVDEAAQAKWTDVWVGGIALALSAWRKWPVRTGTGQ